MKRLSVSLALIAFLASLSLAQNASSVYYGQPSDLKGLKKVYIDTGTDTKSGDNLVKDLKKSKLGFEVVDDRKDAEILLGYSAGPVRRRSAGSVVASSVDITTETERSGAGIVVALNARGKDRLVHSFQDVLISKWDRDPVDKFVREFIKVYKKGNDLK